MTYPQAMMCSALEEAGYIPVAMPIDAELTPVPGVILFANYSHSELLQVLPDGSTRNLLKD